MSIIKDKLKTKDGRQYRFKVYYHDADNKLKPFVSKRYLTMKEAKAEERLFLLNRDTPVKKKIKTVAFDYFKDLKTRVKGSTYYTYNKIYNAKIKKHFENRFIDEIRVHDIENWKNLLMKTMLSSSANQCYVVLKEIFVFANRKYELNYNPVILAGRIKAPTDEKRARNKTLRYITYDEFLLFKKCLKAPLFKCFFTTLYLTGMRKGEAQALTWNDIDFKNKTILVNKTISFLTEKGNYNITSTKTNLVRKVSISKSLIIELVKYHNLVKEYGNYKDTWFVFGNEDVLKDYQIKYARKQAFKESGVREITTHEFRHSHVSLCISEYLKKGETDANKFLLMMSQRMGHGIRVMQEVYLHLFPETQDKIVDLLDDL